MYASKCLCTAANCPQLPQHAPSLPPRSPHSPPPPQSPQSPGRAPSLPPRLPRSPPPPQSPRSPPHGPFLPPRSPPPPQSPQSPGHAPSLPPRSPRPPPRPQSPRSPPRGPSPPPQSPPRRDHRISRTAFDINALKSVAIHPKHTDALAFVDLLRTASLDDPIAKLNDTALYRLRHPPCTQLTIDDEAVRFGIETYFSLEHSMNSSYESIRQSAGRCFNGSALDVPSHYSIEKMISEYMGVESIEHDMCPNTCVAFTGPYSALDRCPICEEERYDSIRLRTSGRRSHVACQKFVTIPLGPQLQALWCDPQHAEDIGYL